MKITGDSSLGSSPALPRQQGRTLLQVVLKRVVDIVFSMSGLVLLSPLFGLIALWVKRDSPGPAFYRGERLGRAGRHFDILKFRTMYERPESYQGPRITARKDHRITRAGHFLRDSKLNELPQLVNVLRGDMSLVGPRPEDPSFLDNYTEEQRAILSVRPGITSLATVLYADEERRLPSIDVTETYLRSIMPKKLRLEALYVRNQSLLLDLDILLRTLLVLIPRFRDASLPVEKLIMGPLRRSRLFITWFTIDAAIAFVSIAASLFAWRAAGPLDVGLGRSFVAGLVMTAIFSSINWLGGLQRVQWRYAGAQEAGEVILSGSFSTIMLLLVGAFMPEPRLPIALLAVSSLLALAGFLTARYRRQLLAGLTQRLDRLRLAGDAGRERVLIVGCGDAGELTIKLLRNSAAGHAFEVIGIVDDDISKLGRLVHRVPVIGLCDRIPEIVDKQGIGTIAFSIHTIEAKRREGILRLCRETSARTVVMPDIFTFLESRISPQRRQTRITENGSFLRRSDDGMDVSAEALMEEIGALADIVRRGDYAAAAEALVGLDQDLKENIVEASARGSRHPG
ncbi:MAG: sugar transferase [Anaerolineales bacterium]